MMGKLFFAVLIAVLAINILKADIMDDYMFKDCIAKDKAIEMAQIDNGTFTGKYIPCASTAQKICGWYVFQGFADWRKQQVMNTGCMCPENERCMVTGPHEYQRRCIQCRCIIPPIEAALAEMARQNTAKSTDVDEITIPPPCATEVEAEAATASPAN